jgi:hypothetical protein
MTHLILHKVRGEPAFDVAEKMHCPVCEGARQGLDHGQDYAGNCNSCDDGWWWIIPTSGHRAYPWKTWSLETLFFRHWDGPEALPENWPDHYEVDKGEAPKSNFNIMTIISPMMTKIKRRL